MNTVPDFKALFSGPARTDCCPPQEVRRRKVLYVAGFDPLGPRRYRELYRREGPRQGGISGYRLTVQGQRRIRGGNFRWTAVLRQGASRTVSEFEFLGWEDIVRHSIRPSLCHVYGLMFRTLWIYLSTGAIRGMCRLPPGPLIAGLVPAALMIFYLVYAGMIGLAAALLAAGPLDLPVFAAVPAGALAWLLAMLGTRVFEDQMMIYFMVNDLGYSAQLRGRYPAPLSDRLDVFAGDIGAAMAGGDYDEVLVVGHSSGAQLAVTALARALRRHGKGSETKVGLMTLGQSVAMTAFLPQADELRADLAQLADDAGIFWLDVTAPGDGACFALTDPSAICRRGGRPDHAANPVVISAAFRQTMDADERRRNRWRLLRLHFQYLCAFANPQAFDYFLITAGPRSLASRFAGRPCSPSMYAEPVAPVCHPG